MAMTDAERLDDLIVSLTNWTPGPEAVGMIEDVREAGKQLGAQLIAATRDSRARAIALTELETAIMWGVKAIVLADRHDTLVREGLAAAAEEI